MDENRGGGFRGNQGPRDRQDGNRGFRGNQGGSRGGNGGGFRGNDGPKEMHKAVCADCKAECEVPFKPSGDRPVYCRNCFANHKKF